jgi:hypothetical protein
MNLSLASRASTSTCDYNAININQPGDTIHWHTICAHANTRLYMALLKVCYITESAVAVVFIFFSSSARRVIFSIRATEINRPLIGRETPQLANTASGVGNSRLFPFARLNMDSPTLFSFFLWTLILSS